MCVRRQQTILEAAVAKGLPYLDAESANADIVRVHQRVGELEGEVAALKAALEAATGKCYYRRQGWCRLDCGVRPLCNHRGLKEMDLTRECESLREGRISA